MTTATPLRPTSSSRPPAAAVAERTIECPLPPVLSLPDAGEAEQPPVLTPAPVEQALEQQVDQETEHFRFGMPTVWAMALQALAGSLILGLATAAEGNPIPGMLGFALFGAAITAPFRQAGRPYAAALEPDGRVRFQLPLSDLTLPAPAITALVRTTSTDSEGWTTYWLEISAAPHALHIEATWNRKETERLIEGLRRVNPRIVIHGAWVRE